MVGRSFQLLEKLHWEQDINKAIATADPLNMDSFLCMLPSLNEQKKIEVIREYLAEAITHIQSSLIENFVQASAAIRDLCMFAASLIRYNIEQTDCVPGFSR